MKQKWWKVNILGIKPVDVEKCTDKCVWIDGRRSNRSSDWDKYFPTYTEARQHVIDAARKRYVSAEVALQRAKTDLEKAELIPESPVSIAAE